jgi:hypothetical protein
MSKKAVWMGRGVWAIVAAALLMLSVSAPPASADVSMTDYVANPRVFSGAHFTGPSHTTGARGVWSPDYLPACERGWVCIDVLNFQDAQVNGWTTYKLYEYRPQSSPVH